jgi:hypothetical protein
MIDIIRIYYKSEKGNTILDRCVQVRDKHDIPDSVNYDVYEGIANDAVNDRVDALRADGLKVWCTKNIKLKGARYAD